MVSTNHQQRGFRKSAKMRELEAKHGRPIQALVAEAMTAHGTVERAAESLGVPRGTFGYWLVRLGIEVRKVATVPGVD